MWFIENPRFLKIPFRLIRNCRTWRVRSLEYCPPCNSMNPIVFSTEIQSFLKKITSPWEQSIEFKEQLLERKNYFCTNCLSNFRMRAVARTVLNVLDLGDTSDLLRTLAGNPQFRIFETSNYNIFREPQFSNFPNYFVSEYFEDQPLGTLYGGIRNENIECLTFPDGYFDILVTSEVLEHVADLDRALEEIRRVLKPGGFHVFSIPVDLNLEKTVERAKIVDRMVVHLLPPEMHGDTIRSEGILAFRDFGKDILEYLARDGFHYGERKHSRSGMLLTAVYHARKGERKGELDHPPAGRRSDP